MAGAYGIGDVSIFDGAGLASSSATIRVGVTNNTYKLGGTNYLAYVELPNVLLTNNTIINNGTNVYTSGGINYTASTANFNTVLGSTNGVGETGGSYSLTKMGGGALTLNGANTYSGGTIMNGGFLYVTNSGTMGSAGSAVAVNGGTLDLGNATRTNGAVTVGGGLVTNGTLSASSYALTNAGTISAALTGSGALTKTGSGTSVLSGANDYSGGTTVSAGTLQGDTTSLQGNISNNATVSFNQVGDGTYSGNMSGAGAVNVDAGGVVTFSGNNTYTGVTAITSATLKLGSANALGAGGSDWTTTGTKLGINAILDLNGKNIANEALGMNASTAYVTNSSTTTAIWGGAISLTNGTNQFNVASGKDITLNGSIVYGSSSRQLMKNGDGVLTVAGSANTNQGIINVNAGTFRMGNATALGANTNNDVNVASGATLDVNGYTATASSRTIKLGGAGVSGAGALQNSRASTSATVNNTVVLNADASVGGAGDMTLAGGISGSAGLTKVGAGTTTLTGAGSYTGITTVSQGTLKLNRVNGGAVSAQTIAINGGTLLLGQANQISESSAVTLGGGTLSTGGFADRVGQLTVSANSAISGLVVASGKGVASSSSDFLFSSVDLTSYATSSGSNLNLGSSYTYGQSINIASSNYTGWTGYSTTSLNNFATKIQFGNTGMKAQINFNGGTGAAALTYVTAIPEPKVYVAMAMLVALVGVAEYKRRKRVVRAG
jgi:fibronectin-binding autotransporter adhesin